MKEQKLNAYGMTPLTGKHYFVYGLGNFASQLSWTMVSTYLSIFYTDVFGLGVGAVALLMLIAKVWDGINDPMMGTLMGAYTHKMGTFQTLHFCRRDFPCNLHDTDIYSTGIWRTCKTCLCLHYLHWLGNVLYNDKRSVSGIACSYDS